MISCYFCDQTFTVAIAADDIQEKVLFCPFCSTELVDPEMAEMPDENDD
jgi:hypothetical protein